MAKDNEEHVSNISLGLTILSVQFFDFYCIDPFDIFNADMSSP